MARRAHLPVQKQPHAVLVASEHCRKLRAARVEVEAAREAVVEEPLHRLLARVAVARSVAGGLGEEVEGAFGVERVEQRRRRNGTVCVKIKVTDGALVA